MDESSFISNDKSQSLEEKSNHTAAIMDFLVQTGYHKDYVTKKKKDLAFFPEVFFSIILEI